MPYGAVRLIPGQNVERTPTLLEAGYSQIQKGRFKGGLFQKIGGCVRYYPSAVAGVPRAMHAWEDLNRELYLGVGTTTQLGAINNGALTDLTPQTLSSDVAPDFTTTISTATVEIVDANISDVTTDDFINLKTPVAVGGLVLAGIYQIASITGTHSYTITAAADATSSVTSGGAVPVFNTTSGTASVVVTLTAHGLAVGNTAIFSASTTGGGITISGSYKVLTVPTADTFTIAASVQASSTATFSMNGGDAEILYYINLGPSAAGAGFGLGGFGLGGFGTGVVPSAQTGTPISTTDWVLDNWGEIFLACPDGGGIYAWLPSSGYQNAQFVGTAPPFNTGMFVAMPELILIAWGSTRYAELGIDQDPLLVRWSDILDYTNFEETAVTQAGSYHVPTGSRIVGAIQGSQQGLIWTDIDLYSMSYLGQPYVFGFNKVSGGSGLVSRHAVTQLNGIIYWMSQSNFYTYSSAGALIFPCTVWDFVFQNIDQNNLDKCWAWADTTFAEIFFFFPSASGGLGQCDSYAKYNTVEKTWDSGNWSRSCGVPQSLLGTPIAASPVNSIIYQHEQGYDDDGEAISWSMSTGYFVIGNGEEVAFVDWILPDFKWGTYAGSNNASVQVTVSVVNFPNQTPITYGPYTVNASTQAITARFRGRQVALTFSGNDLGTFLRLGLIRYRWAADGRI